MHKLHCLFFHVWWSIPYTIPMRLKMIFSMIFFERPLHVQAICANRVFAQTFWQCRVLFARLRKLLAWNQNSLIFFAQAASACAVWVLACTNKPHITRSWHRVVVPAVVICSTIDHAMSSKGTAEKRQFLIEFIEKYRSLPALWCVTSTEYRNKKNGQSAKLLNKYKEKYLNVLCDKKN